MRLSVRSKIKKLAATGPQSAITIVVSNTSTPLWHIDIFRFHVPFVLQRNSDFTMWPHRLAKSVRLAERSSFTPRYRYLAFFFSRSVPRENQVVALSTTSERGIFHKVSAVPTLKNHKFQSLQRTFAAVPQTAIPIHGREAADESNSNDGPSNSHQDDEYTPRPATKPNSKNKQKHHHYHHNHHQQQQHQAKKNTGQQKPARLTNNNFQDRRLPCRDHWDPLRQILPTSDWVHIEGTLPLTSLDEVVNSIENILYDELERGVMDLEAPWNPMQDAQAPFLPLKQDENTGPPLFYIQAAHVVLSPFGRPSGWHLKLANASMVHALVSRSGTKQRVHVAWKMVQVKQYHPTADMADTNSNMENEHHQNYSPFNHIEGFLVDDTMVRFENCPDSLDEEHLRYLLSRYELARSGPTVLPWRGSTNDGKRQRMFVVRFHSAEWARAAVREKQDTQIAGKGLRLVQYPKQRLLSQEKEQNQEQSSQQSA
jgi:hypothetical protein